MLKAYRVQVSSLNPNDEDNVLNVVVEVESTRPHPSGEKEAAIDLPVHAQVRSALEAARPTTGY